MVTADATHGPSRGYWLRVGVVSLAAAGVVTGLFAILGHAGPVSVVLWRSLIHSATMAGLVAGTLPRTHRLLDRLGAVTRWTVRVAILLLLAAVGALLACALITALGLNGRAPVSACFASDFGIDALLTLTLGIAMSLYEAQRARLDSVTLALRTKELEHERARKTALEARLASLESRLQPHFLFNTLNAISALIQEDPDEAERTVERLAALLRFSLDATRRGLVPLTHELKIVGDYLEIERLRLGERLAWTVEVAPGIAECEIPPLALQTLVENAVKHAIAPRPGGGRLRVLASAAGDDVALEVWDDGPGFTPDAMLPGHGLDNLRDRLASRFGPAATLTVARERGGTCVTVRLPRGDGPRA